MVVSLQEESRQLRDSLPEFTRIASLDIERHKGAIPAAVSITIAKSLADAQRIRQGLFKQALSHRNALYRIDNLADHHNRVVEIIIATGAATTLYENHLALTEYFDRHPKLIAKLNEEYPEFNVAANYFNSSNKEAERSQYRRTYNDAVKFLSDNSDAIADHVYNSTPQVQALYQSIVESPLNKGLPLPSIIESVSSVPLSVSKSLIDRVKSGFNNLKFSSSKLIGNTVGLVKWRAGKLNNDAKTLSLVSSRLEPGDILLEKTPFTLTDISIPGHFGHAAIFTGSADQLVDNTASPVILDYLPKIRRGQQVVEALRSGVQLSPLESFLNVDDVAILRPKSTSSLVQLSAVDLSLRNLGKRYDFNFDVNTSDKIVCSELVYIAYPSVNFSTDKVLGSFTITPDDIAAQASSKESAQLNLVLFLHKGKVVFDANDSSIDNDKGKQLYDQLVGSI